MADSSPAFQAHSFFAHSHSNSFSRVCRSVMSNQQTFDFLNGDCSQSKTRVKDLSHEEGERGSPKVSRAVKEFRAATDWQSLDCNRISSASVAEGDCSGDDSELGALVAESQDRESVLRKLRNDLGCLLPKTG